MVRAIVFLSAILVLAAPAQAATTTLWFVGDGSATNVAVANSGTAASEFPMAAEGPGDQETTFQ